jgi:putative toxin-antitoxin system antitoxin component (TIGR02293 family)
MSAHANPVAKMLGVSAIEPLKLISAVENGFPLAALDRVVHAVAPAEKNFAHRIVARATLARRRKALAETQNASEARLSGDESARLARLATVWAQAIDVWGSEDSARRFMFEPHPLLHDRRPVDVVLDSEFGRPAVEGILGRLQAGTAV